MHRLHRIGVVLSILLSISIGTGDSYSIGDVNSRALRGVWRLTSLDEGGLPFERSRPAAGRGFFPPRSAASADPGAVRKMKEFTTYPLEEGSDARDDAGPASPAAGRRTEIFIRLEDDHTFRRCAALRSDDGGAANDDEGRSPLEEELEMEVERREGESFARRGTWDFVDGELILAADRPKRGGGAEGGDAGADTILVGRVAVREEDGLTENPALERRRATSDRDAEREGAPASGPAEANYPADSPSSRPRKGAVDVHLSVPKGKIKTGKFMYPKTHPSFFEQPIYRPQSKGRFELRQILGDCNAGLADDGDDDDLTELFRKKDLAGKRFYLSAFPLPTRRRKFERWDVRESRYVQEEYAPTAEERKDEESRPGKNMQVVAVELFANNTFSTLYGLGSSTVLRGKWSVVGSKRDQLSMMVYRFGFGRSVAGSTFSEGSSLTQNDEKVYWGVIKEAERGGGGDDAEGDAARDRKIEIEGAVMVGWGLEPCSVGRFKMIEMDDYMLEEEADGEEEEEYEEMSADDVIENASSLDSALGSEESDCGDGTDPFDAPGAFE